MNKSDLVRAIANDAGVSLKSSESMVNAFADNVMKAVGKGDKVSIVGFGNFASITRKARMGRNPATGAEINIPEKNVPKFSPGKEFKSKV